ncbi:MAG TPA: signal peptidase I [Thermoanaerobaculia bacterium]|jgi:signal peptidase I|nr:signal peptidase I [Thermoanaerobaculia bacterium]
MENPPSFKKSAWGAVLLSLFQPGFGQIYAGRTVRGALAFVVYLASVLIFFCGVIGRSFVGLVVAMSLIAVFYIGTAVDAGLGSRSAVSSNPIWQRWYAVLALALLFQFGLRYALPAVQRLKTYYIPSGSMEPTLQIGDHLVAALDTYRSAPPSRNDIAIFALPDNPKIDLVERIVALPGETVELRNKVLFVNGHAVQEPWTVHKDPNVGAANDPISTLSERDQMRPVLVPPGRFFAMGDNRDSSYDSRFYGPVPLENLKGKALYLYWSKKAGRMGKQL